MWGMPAAYPEKPPSQILQVTKEIYLAIIPKLIIIKCAAYLEAFTLSNE